MTESDTPDTAFVLMKFASDPWNDPTYQVISEVVAEAGYQPLRADEIPTSGPVVEEVTRQIAQAPLLVIDTSGQSHSVSYELGYAHGVGRPHDGTIILKSVDSGPIPFNYAHFRLHIYKNRAHLRRLLRSRLNLSTPLRSDQLAFALCFSVMPTASAYGEGVAEAILSSLGTLRFSGRCEYYAGEPLVAGEHFYVVGLGLKNAKGETPTSDWWSQLCECVPQRDLEQRTQVVLNKDLSEIGEVGAMRSQYLSRGIAEFETGTPVAILGVDDGQDSWFLLECRRRMNRAQADSAEKHAGQVSSKAAPSASSDELSA